MTGQIFIMKLELLKKKNFGATALEYTLIITLITLVCYGGYKRVGSKYLTLYNGISSGLKAADNAGIR